MSPSGQRDPTPFGQAASPDEAETVSTDDPDATHETVLALYVTGPFGGTRHVLPTGLVTLGRSADAAIVVSDPRVSRVHAALHVGKEVMVSDLGSANGTFLGNERLPIGDARPLEDGHGFSIGDSVLVVRSCSLGRAGTRKLASIAEVPARHDTLRRHQYPAYPSLKDQLIRRVN